MPRQSMRLLLEHIDEESRGQASATRLVAPATLVARSSTRRLRRAPRKG